MLSETEFYDRLAESFDVMTDWKSRLAFEMSFLEATLARFNAKSILDCACGTGWHAIALTQRGFRVVGSDITATMIARAKGNAQREKIAAEFHVAGFQDLRASFKEKFDAVLCLGNSFVHVLEDDVALDSLRNMHDCLRDGGVLVMHNLNYDKRWKDKPRWFAVNSGTLSGRETLIWRFADYQEARSQNSRNSEFLLTLHCSPNLIAAHGRCRCKAHPQRPYQKLEIEDLLMRAGFRDLEFYGDLQGKPFDAGNRAIW